jgi:phage gp45-like
MGNCSSTSNCNPCGPDFSAINQLATKAGAYARQAKNAWLEFNALYLGAFAVAPTVDNEGDPLQTGALYWNTALTQLFAWSGTSWVVAANFTEFTPFLATGTTFSRNLVTRFADVVNVKDFGAVGDGIADDTIAFLSASNAAKAIFVPSGIYVLDNLIITAAELTLFGSGTSSILKWKGGTQATDMISIGLSTSYFKMDNLTIDGNRQNHVDQTSYYAAIDAAGANNSEFIFTNCKFTNGRIIDIRVIGPTIDPQSCFLEISNCWFNDGISASFSRAAMFVNASEGVHVKAIANKFTQTLPNGVTTKGRGGINMQRQPGSTATAFGSMKAIGNSFYNVGLYPDALGCVYVYSGADSAIIEGNSAYNTWGTAFAAKADCRHIVISNNTVQGNSITIPSSESSPSIVLFGQLATYSSSLRRSAQISGNSINVGYFNGIFIDGQVIGEADRFADIIVAQNIIRSTYRCINFRNTNGITIDGNYMTGADQAILGDTEASGTVSICGNTFASCDAPIRVQGTLTSAKVSICGNAILSANTVSGSCIDINNPPSTLYVKNNNIDGCNIWLRTNGVGDTAIITDNTIINETFSWSKIGSYPALWYATNISEQPLGLALQTLTIATGVVTIFSDFHYIDTESGAATDDLDTINGGYDGQLVRLQTANSARDVVFKDGTGNLKLAGDFTADNAADTLTLIKKGSTWFEISRSSND